MKLRFFNHLIICTLLLMSHIILPATVIVNSTGDQPAANAAVSPDSTAGVGIITLRSAFEFSQGGAVAPTNIIFDIPTTDPGFQPATNSWRISHTTSMSVNAAYRATTKQVIVNGYLNNTAHPAQENTNAMEFGSNAILRIEIRGPGTVAPTAAFRVDNVTGCEFRGLCINGFTGFPGALGTAVRWTNAPSTIVAGNFIGLDITGMSVYDPDTGAYLGFGRGHQISGSNNSVYGGNLAADSNVIAGCISQNLIIFTTSNMIVRRNYIGTNKLGSATFDQITIGLEYLGPTGLIVDNNVISGNNDGLQLLDGDNIVVTNNKIGTNAAGTANLGNIGSGILLGALSPSTNIDITNNIVSGNKVGLRLGFNFSGFNLPLDDVTVQGNKVGTDVTGKRVLGNERSGILVQRVTDSLIGSTLGNVSEQNIISVNKEDGIRITEGSSGILVHFNKIGTDILGIASSDINSNSFGNTLNGIRIGIGQGAANNNEI